MHVVAGKRPPCWIEIESFEDMRWALETFQIRQIALLRNHKVMMNNLRVAGDKLKLTKLFTGPRMPAHFCL